MELVGLKVKHITLGTGIIAEQVNAYITVEFPEKTSKFVFPDSFQKFLKAEDEKIQKEISDRIAREVAEKNRRTETIQNQARTPLIAKARNSKTSIPFDKMFAPDYHAEKMAKHPILNYQQVETQFGIRISGFGRGINPTDHTVVLISSIRKASDHFVYHDRWTADGDYLYSGEGRTGNQAMTKGNLAIKTAARYGKTIHLFVKFSPQEYYYQGVFELVDYTYEDEKDENGNPRKEYKFRLRKI